MEAGHVPGAYAADAGDAVRDGLEAVRLAGIAGGALRRARGGRVLELGSSAGLGSRLDAHGMTSYSGVDFRPPETELPGPHRVHDLREGLGAAADEPFDLCVAAFGLASHLHPDQLGRLLGDLAGAGGPGAMVAIEALGLFSLEWPGLWETAPGAGRCLPYRLGHDVVVHPWAPPELSAVLETAGIRPVGVWDRSLQTGPKLDEGRYWPGLPPLRHGIGELLRGRDPEPSLSMALPPLPASPAAAAHQRLAARRRALVAGRPQPPGDLARDIWALERDSAGGLGHGLMVVGLVA